MSELDGFTGLYQLNKTIRWELRPVGPTGRNMEESGFLTRDRSRKDAYAVVKKLSDRCYRDFIDDTLSTLDIDWGALADAMAAFKSNDEQKNRKELERIKSETKTAISRHMREDVRCGDLFRAELLSKLLPPLAETDEERDALREFDRFAGYFQDFYKNRENIVDVKRGSCASRIVDDNFPRHFDNCAKYQRISSENPELILELRKSMTDWADVDPDELFSLGNYGRLVRQKDIDAYNRVIGSVYESETDVHRGFNNILNEFHQKNPDSPKVMMQKLRKQILSVPESGSYRPRGYSSAEELGADLQTLWTSLMTNGTLTEPAQAIDRRDFDTSKVYITNAGIRTLSQRVFSNWETVGGLLQLHRIEELGDSASKSRNKIEKWLNSDSFSLDTVEASVAGRMEGDLLRFVADELRRASEEASRAFTALGGCGFTDGDTGWHQKVKDFVDSLLRYRDVIALFCFDQYLPLDRAFYDPVQAAYDDLLEAVRAYNRCRNYITKKPYSTDKFRMSFDCAHLADGWDISKERDYNSFIFRRDGRYYLGIRNPEWRFRNDFDDMADPGCTDFYEKLVYKQLPDPKKMLPKVFFSKKGLEKYRPPEDLVADYRAGRHKQGETFDLGFCHRLIDFYKKAIDENEDWRTFGFRFRDTSEYGSITEFYRDVEVQGYSVRFDRIPRESIEGLMEDGRLLLFQMYNKDYSDNKRSGGTPNLHTMYWEAAMSEDNLRDVSIKLSGFAELFWRDASIKNPVVHRKGSVLVNRNDADGKPIPDDVYYELCRYRNGIICELSDRAKAYEGQIVSKEAEYDIEKDRRYCHDKMFLHVPLSFNFKAPAKADVNSMVLDWIRRDGDVRFLGIDRGERNLLYLSLVGSDGRIIWQRSLNTIVQRDGNGGAREIDYQGKLVERERERRESRRSWTSIGAIRNLKEGYVSAAVHEICRIAVEENAVIVVEDLNYGFKNSRKKVERQTYQTFERMLIGKLQHMVLKDREPRVPGGVLNPYQLCGPIDSMENIPRQCGILIHVVASYTSRIDPVTGFANLFNTSGITNNRLRADFLSRMDHISYNASEDVFEFVFDYRNFAIRAMPGRTKWTVCTYGDRCVWNRDRRVTERISPTRMIKDALVGSGIEYGNGQDLRDAIVASEAAPQVYRALELTLEMRVTDGDEDIIVSPVRGPDGRHFVSGEAEGLPCDADANGAYCIAMKGLMLANRLRETGKDDLSMKNTEWLSFMQER